MSCQVGSSRAPGRGLSQEGHTDHPGNCEEDRVCGVESQQVRLRRGEKVRLQRAFQARLKSSAPS